MLSEDNDFRSLGPTIDQVVQAIEQLQGKIFIYEQLDSHSNKPIKQYCQRLIIADLKKDLENGNIFKGIFNNIN